MRILIATIVLLFASCVAPEGKGKGNNNDPANNANNVAMNSSASNSAMNSSQNNAMNGSNNNGTTTNPNSENVLPNSDNVDPNNMTTLNNVATGCGSRAECLDNQECVDMVCVDHEMCETSYVEAGDGFCTAEWFGCSGSNYRFECFPEGDWFCSCTVDEVTGETVTFTSDPCDPAAIHYAANAACGWLLPAVPR